MVCLSKENKGETYTKLALCHAIQPILSSLMRRWCLRGYPQRVRERTGRSMWRKAGEDRLESGIYGEGHRAFAHRRGHWCHQAAHEIRHGSLFLFQGSLSAELGTLKPSGTWTTSLFVGQYVQCVKGGRGPRQNRGRKDAFLGSVDVTINHPLVEACHLLGGRDD